MPTRKQMIDFKWLGLVEYGDALTLQLNTIEKVRFTCVDQILGLEHPLIATLGIRSQIGDLKGNLPYYKIKRGGEIVIHNPGQLVIYPVFDLKKNNISIKKFVSLLEDVTQELLLSYGIETFKKNEPGLYTSLGKIAMIGLQVSRGITQHGIAINVTNDLKVFKSNSICGIQNQPMDKVQNYNPHVNCQNLFASWGKILSESLTALKT